MILQTVLQRLEGICYFLSEGFKIISCICLVVLIFTFGYLVYGRYVLNNTPTWVEQTSLLLVAYITFISAAIGVWEQTHIAVDTLENYIAKQYILYIKIGVNIIVCILGGMLVYHAHSLFVFNMDTEIPILQIPESIRSVPIMISGALTMLFTMTKILHLFHQCRTYKTEM